MPIQTLSLLAFYALHFDSKNACSDYFPHHFGISISVLGCYVRFSLVRLSPPTTKLPLNELVKIMKCYESACKKAC